MSDTPVTKGTTALEFHVFDIKCAIIQLGPAGFCKQTSKRRIQFKNHQLQGK